jgi:hypothetical protein
LVRRGCPCRPSLPASSEVTAGLVPHTAADIDYGTARITHAKRASRSMLPTPPTRNALSANNPPTELPTAAWINRPFNTQEDTQ